MSYSKTQPFDRHGILKILLKSAATDKNRGQIKLRLETQLVVVGKLTASSV